MTDKLDSFKVLPEEEYEVARMLYERGKALGCKTVSKTRADGYRVSFVKANGRKTLFWMEAAKNALLLKANLIHVDEYGDIMADCPDAVKKPLTTIKECEHCHPSCGSLHVPYHIDGVEYAPCYFKGPYFKRMSRDEWEFLWELIAAENGIGVP